MPRAAQPVDDAVPGHALGLLVPVSFLALVPIQLARDGRNRAADPGGNVRFQLATGAGAGSRRAIGTATFAGMLAATLVGLVFVPGLYVLFQTLREKVRPRETA